MICAYIDDAGNTGTNLADPAQPMHYVGALLIPENCWAQVNAGVAQIEAYARSHGYNNSIFELHGCPLFLGLKSWKMVGYNERIEVYRQCVQLIENLGLFLTLGCCDKVKLRKRYKYPEHPHAITFWLCMERIARFANVKKSLGIMIADECSRSMKEISKKVLTNYRKHGAPYGVPVNLTSLIDTVHFMESTESAHIQLCDISLYSIRRWESVACPRIQPLALRILNRVFLRRIFPY